MDIGMLVLIPPALVLILALATETLRYHFFSALFCCFVGHSLALWPAVKLVVTTLVDQTGIPDVIYRTGSYDKILMYGFLACLRDTD